MCILWFNKKDINALKHTNNLEKNLASKLQKKVALNLMCR